MNTKQIKQVLNSKLNIKCSKCGDLWMVGDRERTEQEKSDWTCPKCEKVRLEFEAESDFAREQELADLTQEMELQK